MEQPPGSPPAAWDMAAVVREFEPRLTRYALHLVGDLEAARDVVQDTFVALWRSDPRRVADQLGAWLFTVCRNGALDMLRKERPMDPLDSAHALREAAPGPAPTSRAEQLDDQARLLVALGDLPARQQEVVRLRFHGELSYREISQITGLSESNVGVLLHQAVYALRDRLVAAEANRAAGA